MRFSVSKIKTKFFISTAESQLYLLFSIVLLSKFIYFDILWCILTSFQPFSWPEYYSNKLLVTFLLMLPFMFFHLRRTYYFIALLLDLFFIANLFYLRTYYTAIPLSNYKLIGNLSDFSASVVDSFRGADLYFPLSTLFLIFKNRQMNYLPVYRFSQRLPYIGRYLTVLTAYSILTAGIICHKGGFLNVYEHLLRVNTYSSGTPTYTLFGTLLYQYENEEKNYTSDTESQIKKWFEAQPPFYALSDSLHYPKDCMIILVESLESWVLERKVEDIEITPCLNALIRENSTLYAPYVQTQVGDGRSIDGQLLLHSGLFPLQQGTYSIKYPFTYYPSLIKAMKEERPTRATCMIIDRKEIWNAQTIEPALGFDTLLSRSDFIQDENIGGKRRLSDGSFFRQCAEKLKSPEICPDSASLFIQCVTITGHSPFWLPPKMRRISFSGKIPRRMNDYMTVANYTDHAIGKFIRFLRSNPRFAHMMIIITGDHEGLAETRKNLCNTPEGKGVISPDEFTPFIVINSPVSGRYEKVMGQIDMYPTLLSLLGLKQYAWKGLGQNILDPQKKPFAVTRGLSLRGDTLGLTLPEQEQARTAWKISDYIIRYDYFTRSGLNHTVSR